MNQTKLGVVGIENIPEIKREDLFKSVFPLSEELAQGAEGSEYHSKENLARQIALNLNAKGGDVFYSEEAIDTYGLGQVQRAFRYYDYFRRIKLSDKIDAPLKGVVMAWIADNIFDLERMKPAEE